MTNDKDQYGLGEWRWWVAMLNCNEWLNEWWCYGCCHLDPLDPFVTSTLIQHPLLILHLHLYQKPTSLSNNKKNRNRYCTYMNVIDLWINLQSFYMFLFIFECKDLSIISISSWDRVVLLLIMDWGVLRKIQKLKMRGCFLTVTLECDCWIIFIWHFLNFTSPQ